MTSVATNSYIARLLPLRLPRVCVAVTDVDAEALVDKAEALVRDNTFLEFRLDYLPRPALALPRIKRFMEYHPHVVAIATCRRTASGGKFKGSLAAQLEILGKGRRSRLPVARYRTAERFQMQAGTGAAPSDPLGLDTFLSRFPGH